MRLFMNVEKECAALTKFLYVFASELGVRILWTGILPGIIDSKNLKNIKLDDIKNCVPVEEDKELFNEVKNLFHTQYKETEYLGFKTFIRKSVKAGDYVRVNGDDLVFTSEGNLKKISAENTLMKDYMKELENKTSGKHFTKGFTVF